MQPGLQQPGHDLKMFPGWRREDKLKQEAAPAALIPPVPLCREPCQPLYPALGTQWSPALNGPQLLPGAHQAWFSCQQALQSSANQQTQQCHWVPALPCFSI